MSKVYTDNSTTEILGVQVHVKYVDEFTIGANRYYLIDAWVNYGTELEVQVTWFHNDQYLDEIIEDWLDDPESFYGEPDIA